jgi:hypothetical protein
MCLPTFLPHLHDLALETVTADADHLTVVMDFGPFCRRVV